MKQKRWISEEMAIELGIIRRVLGFVNWAITYGPHAVNEELRLIQLPPRGDNFIAPLGGNGILKRYMKNYCVNSERNVRNSACVMLISFAQQYHIHSTSR